MPLLTLSRDADSSEQLLLSEEELEMVKEWESSDAMTAKMIFGLTNHLEALKSD